jgi:hypothetical protein
VPAGSRHGLRAGIIERRFNSARVCFVSASRLVFGELALDQPGALLDQTLQGFSLGGIQEADIPVEDIGVGVALARGAHSLPRCLVTEGRCQGQDRASNGS